MSLCVLVTTMNQTDFSIYEKMNLQTDAIIANQCDRNEIVSKNINGHNVTMVSTATRGLSRNRNIALAHTNQNTDYILFSDDDLIFDEGYEQKIIDEFIKHPKAEAIKFNIHDLSKSRKIAMKRIEKFEKATRFNMSASGVCGLVIKSNILKINNLHFNENFGAGADLYAGEDSIFIAEMFDKKINMYRSPIDIAGIDQSESNWFSGHDEKYYYFVGAYHTFRHTLSFPLWFLRVAQRTKKSELTFSKKLIWMRNGRKGYKLHLSYEDFSKRFENGK